MKSILKFIQKLVKKRTNAFILLGLFVTSLIYYYPSFNTFFSNDDWFHLRISQVNNLNDFISFYSFTPLEHSTTFYRPLSTQTVFFLMQSLFGLNIFWYRLVEIVLFTIILWLTYRFVAIVSGDTEVGILASLIYLMSSTNFTRIYYFSTIQELLMTIFILACLLLYDTKKYFLSFCFFILALLSKETAVMTPLLIVLLVVFKSSMKISDAKKILTKNLKSFLAFFLAMIVYLYLRLSFFGAGIGDSYQFDFSPFKFLNTSMWYGLWSFGIPEFLVDYVGSGLKIVPKFYTDFPKDKLFILGSSFSLLVIFLISFFVFFKKNIKSIICFGLFWFISLFPVLFLPWHKFTIELTLPLVGFSAIIATLIFSKNNNYLGIALLLAYMIMNIYTHSLYFGRHYTVTRSEIAKSIFDYFENNYPTYPDNSYFEFVNDTTDYGKDFGSSIQAAHAISRSEMLRVLYKNPNINIFFEDYPEDIRPLDKELIKVSTKLFINK